MARKARARARKSGPRDEEVAAMERPKGAFCYYQGASFGAPSPLKKGRSTKSLNSRGGARTNWRGCLKFESEIFATGRNILRVIRGLDPRIHHSSQESFEEDGLPGQ